MIFTEESAIKVAEYLLKKQAVKLNSTTPFVWASGWNSPIYCDNRKTLSYPELRNYIRQQFVQAAREKIAHIDAVAGVATGGIAHGVLLAQELGLPFLYVRSAAKGHGMQNLIEGEIPVGRTVLVVEDLVSTGGSSLQAVTALREAGCEVKSMFTVFDYDFDVKKENFKKANCELISLTNYEYVLKAALEMDYIRENEVEILQEWRSNPQSWKK